MAYTLDIWGILKNGVSDDFQFSIKLFWWPHDQLMKDSRFSEHYYYGYHDYSAELTVDEARELHERFKPNAESYVNIYQPDKIISMLATLDNALTENADKYESIIVKLSEWESGLS